MKKKQYIYNLNYIFYKLNFEKVQLNNFFGFQNILKSLPLDLVEASTLYIDINFIYYSYYKGMSFKLKEYKKFLRRKLTKEQKKLFNKYCYSNGKRKKKRIKNK